MQYGVGWLSEWITWRDGVSVQLFVYAGREAVTLTAINCIYPNGAGRLEMGWRPMGSYPKAVEQALALKADACRDGYHFSPLDPNATRLLLASCHYPPGRH